jgi:hypothetical protein
MEAGETAAAAWRRQALQAVEDVWRGVAWWSQFQALELNRGRVLARCIRCGVRRPRRPAAIAALPQRLVRDILGLLERLEGVN